jgi:hypothetical protein
MRARSAPQKTARCIEFLGHIRLVEDILALSTTDVKCMKE